MIILYSKCIIALTLKGCHKFCGCILDLSGLHGLVLVKTAVYNLNEVFEVGCDGRLSTTTVTLLFSLIGIIHWGRGGKV